MGVLIDGWIDGQKDEQMDEWTTDVGEERQREVNINCEVVNRQPLIKKY